MNTTVESARQFEVTDVRMADDFDHRVGLASVRLGNVTIVGISIWRHRGGELRIYWPRYWDGAMQKEAIKLPPELRTEIELEIVAAFREAKKALTKPPKGERP